MKKNPIKLICNKCGKEPKKNEDKSNQNWKVYDNISCECGGKFKIKIN